jgi:hypothetical protein
MRARKDLLIKVEGKNSEKRYSNFSTDIKNLVNSGDYLCIKFNKSMRQQIYTRTEWFIDEINNRHYVSGHEPKEDDIEHIPVAKRDLKNAEIIKSK